MAVALACAAVAGCGYTVPSDALVVLLIGSGVGAVLGAATTHLGQVANLSESVNVAGLALAKRVLPRSRPVGRLRGHPEAAVSRRTSPRRAGFTSRASG